MVALCAQATRTLPQACDVTDELKEYLSPAFLGGEIVDENIIIIR